jgi:hypothetical protein
MLELDDMELFQLSYCMSTMGDKMMMGGEIRRHASIMSKIKEEMDRRKNATGAYTREGILRQLDEQLRGTEQWDSE